MSKGFVVVDKNQNRNIPSHLSTYSLKRCSAPPKSEFEHCAFILTQLQFDKIHDKQKKVVPVFSLITRGIALIRAKLDGIVVRKTVLRVYNNTLGIYSHNYHVLPLIHYGHLNNNNNYYNNNNSKILIERSYIISARFTNVRNKI